MTFAKSQVMTTEYWKEKHGDHNTTTYSEDVGIKRLHWLRCEECNVRHLFKMETIEPEEDEKVEPQVRRNAQPSKVLVRKGDKGAMVHLYPSKQEGTAPWVAREDQQHPPPPYENATQQVVSELRSRVSGLEERVATLETRLDLHIHRGRGEEPNPQPCTHDSMSRCVQDEWNERRVTFHTGVGWVCVRCRKAVVSARQAIYDDSTSEEASGRSRK